MKPKPDLTPGYRPQLSYPEIHNLLLGAKLMDHDLPHLKLVSHTLEQFAFDDDGARYVGAAQKSAHRIKEDVAMSIRRYCRRKL